MSESTLIVGAGSGLSAALARQCHVAGMTVSLAARDGAKATAVIAGTGAALHQCDTSSIEDVAALSTALDATTGTPDLVVYNPSARTRSPITELEPATTRPVPRSRPPVSVPFWWRSRRHAGCWNAARATSFLPAHPPE